MNILARLFKRRSAEIDEATLQRLRAKELTGGHKVIKEIVRRDGKERVRIVERSNHTFGVTVQRRPEDTDAWFTSPNPGSGASYDSVETAEREAVVFIPWLREQNAGSTDVRGPTPSPPGPSVEVG